MRPFHPDAKCPLDGIRVLDLSRLVAGNMLSLQLADFGAEVIKIEDPGKGDPLRDWRVNGISAHWKVYARNKKSVTLSLREREGIDLLLPPRARARRCSSRISGRARWRPWASARRCCTRAIRSSSSCACRAGARTGRIATGRASAAWSRACRASPPRTAFADRPPVLPPLALADMIAGLYGATAVMVALREVEVNGGKGQVIDLPLLDPIVSILGPEAAIFKLTRTGHAALGQPLGDQLAAQRVRDQRRPLDLDLGLDPGDGGARLPRHRPCPTWSTIRAFAPTPTASRNADACEAPLRDFIRARTLDEALAVFEQAEVTAAPVYDIEQFLADPHVQAREIVTDLPDDEMGSVPMHAVVPRLSDTPGEIRTPAPDARRAHRARFSARSD